MSSGQQPLRNLIHLATGVAAVWVLAVPWPVAQIGLGALLAGALALDLGRRRPGFRAWLETRLPGVYRAAETTGLSGATLLAAGYLLAAVACPARAAAAGILALAVGDPAASVVGRRFGRNPDRPGKTWVGSLACFAAASLALWGLPYLDLAAASAGGAMAALVERRSGRFDNLVIPLAVALLINLWVR